MDRIIAFDLCSFLLLIVLFVSFYMHKMSKGQANKQFKKVVIYVLVSVCADISRVNVTRYLPHNLASQIIFSVLDYTYFLSRNLTSPMMVLFVYALAGKWHYFKNSVKARVIWNIDYWFIVLDIAAGLFTGKLFTISPDLIYHTGILLKVLYVWSVLNFFYIFIVLFNNKKTLGKRKFTLLVNVVLLSLVGVLIQYFHSRFSVEILFTTFPLFFIFLIGQKPEENVDYLAECLNYYAFVDNAKKYDLLKETYSVLLIKINNDKLLEEQFSDTEIKKLLVTVSKSLYDLRTDHEIDVYYLNSYTYAVTCPVIEDSFQKEYTKKCIDFLTAPIEIDNVNANLDVTVCVLKVPDDVADYSEVLTFSEILSECISKRNQICIFSEETKDKNFIIKRELNHIISRAIEQKNFKMYYQPIYNVHTGKFESAEALIRLIDADYGFISPGLFIPAAENSGAIHQIGDYVLQEVFRFISTCNFNELGLKYIELNLSVAQCIEVNLVSKVNSYLKDAGISKEQINLEITESAENLGSDLFKKNVDHLSCQKYAFSLDDFGTGYSNIQRVINLPVDIIKMDKTYADDYKDKDMQIIIKDTISMIHQINRHALIEGIEDRECLKQFEEWNIDFVQGYTFSKPLPEEDFIKFIKENNGCGQNCAVEGGDQ